MKKLLTALAMITTFGSMAQERSQGQIQYDIRLNMQAMAKSNNMDIPPDFPEFVTQSAQLLFNGKHVLIKQVPREAIELEDMDIEMNDLTEPIYINIDTKKVLRLQEKNHIQYLVEINQLTADARMEEPGETKTVLGYNCKKLIIKDSVAQTICWYTDEIPALGSALGLMTNKGVVMELEGGLLSFKATAVLLGKTELSSVLPPKELAVISEAAYKQL